MKTYEIRKSYGLISKPIEKISEINDTQNLDDLKTSYTTDKNDNNKNDNLTECKYANKTESNTNNKNENKNDIYPKAIPNSPKGNNKLISKNSNNSINKSKKKIYKLKTILLGDISVGKTAIISQYAENRYTDDYHCSIGVEFKVKTVNIDNTTLVDLQIWDTCGQEKFKTITRTYYRNKNGCILVFDLTNKNSFIEIEKWIEDLLIYGSKEMVLILVGNKLDLEKERTISFDEAVRLAKKHEIDYFEVSALNGYCVNFMYDILIRSMIEKIKVEEDRDTTVFSINGENKKKKSKCCK